MLVQGIPHTTFNVISPELPAGSAWLANCMIELGVAVWNPWDVVIPNEWQQINKTMYRYNDANNNWQQTLPSLTFGTIYNFDQPHAATFCHRWPYTVAKDQTSVLFFRDPRDLLHSQWRRVKHNSPDDSLTLSAFAHSRFHHFPLSQQEYLLLFMSLWLKYVNDNDGLLLRFEDYRQDAESTLLKVTDFLNISVSNAQHQQAIKSSDYQICRQVEDQLAKHGKLKKKYNFSSTAYEYQAIDEQVDLYPEFEQLLHSLGYESKLTDSNKASIALSDDHIQLIIESIYQDSEIPKESHRLVQLIKDLGLKCDWRFKP